MICCGHPNTCEKPCFHGGLNLFDTLIQPALVDGLSWCMPTMDGVTMIDPKIVWREPEARKPTLDEQCDAAMARLTAHIDSRCAEHREAIRANSQWDISRMHLRHDGYAPAISALGWTMYRNGDMLLSGGSIGASLTIRALNRYAHSWGGSR